MPVYVAIFALVLFGSLTANALQYIRSRKSSQTPPLATDARELLNHLTSGGAVVRVTVLDPEALMLRSPRR